MHSKAIFFCSDIASIVLFESYEFFALGALSRFELKEKVKISGWKLDLKNKEVRMLFPLLS